MAVIEFRPAVQTESVSEATRRVRALARALDSLAELQSIYGVEHRLSREISDLLPTLLESSDDVLRIIHVRYCQLGAAENRLGTPVASSAGPKSAVSSRPEP